MNWGLTGFRKPSIDLASSVAGCRKQNATREPSSPSVYGSSPDLSLQQAEAGELPHWFKWKPTPDLIAVGQTRASRPPGSQHSIGRWGGLRQEEGEHPGLSPGRTGCWTAALGLRPSRPDLSLPRPVPNGNRAGWVSVTPPGDASLLGSGGGGGTWRSPGTLVLIFTAPYRINSKVPDALESSPVGSVSLCPLRALAKAQLSHVHSLPAVSHCPTY